MNIFWHECLPFFMGLIGGCAVGYFIGVIKKHDAVIKALKEVEYKASQDYWNTLNKMNEELNKQNPYRR